MGTNGRPDGESNGCLTASLIKCLPFFICACLFVQAKAFDPLDPTGNITIQWDVMSWTSDGYVATVTLTNYQLFRKVNPPGWALNWTWTDGEIIWNMLGAATTDQGNCSGLAVPGGNLPYCCDRTPTVLDKSTASFGEFTNCCKGGYLGAIAQEPLASSVSFQVQVGNASNSIQDVKTPANFTFLMDGYTCTQPIGVAATISQDPVTLKRTSSLATWKIACGYTAVVAKPTPTCCVSLSAFYNDTIIPCTKCACACGNFTKKANICNITGGTSQPYLVSDGKENIVKQQPSARLCSPDGCPVSIHYHIKQGYKDYWRSKITIINRDLHNNWTSWNLVMEHPNFVNFTEAFSFDIQQIQPFGTNNSAIMWGREGYNKDLAIAGKDGNVQSEFLFAKTPDFTFSDGWAYPRRIFFNGEECVIPSEFPFLPSAASRLQARLSLSLAALLLALLPALLLIGS